MAYTGYVITDGGRVLLQGPADNEHGFALFDGWKSWPAGRGIDYWERVGDNDPRIAEADREQLGWLLEELRKEAA